jgi:hypothetical protein
MTMTITENDFCSYYNYIQELIKKHIQGPLLSPDNFMLEIGTAVPNSPFKKFDECDIDYGDCHMENKMYGLAIISMSWLFNNLKGKVENGHCNNTII